MKRWKLCDLVPPGTSGELQGLLCLLVMICAFYTACGNTPLR